MFLMPENKWARLLAYVTGLVNQKLLLQNEYLAAENRILRAHLPRKVKILERDENMGDDLSRVAKESSDSGIELKHSRVAKIFV
jgi:hypothetical protein